MKLFSTAWTHIRRSPYQAVAATLTMFLTLLISGVFLLTITTSEVVLRYYEQKPSITVFFSDKTSAEEAAELQAKLEETGKTSSIKYTSKEEALTSFRQQFKNDPLIFEMVTAEMLPASLDISASDLRFLAELDPIIRASSGVEDIVFPKDVVDRLIVWTQALRVAGGTMAGLLILNSLFTIMIIIGMKIALRKQEVEILTLVGASPWYIRAPFLLEGGLYGIFGGLAAWLLTIVFLVWAQPAMLTFMGDIPIIAGVLSGLTSPQFLMFLGLLLAVLTSGGFIVGVMGSLIAVSRYLKT